MKWTVAIVAVMVGVTGFCRADAAGHDFDDRSRCFARDGVSPDQRLESCTAVIQSVGQTRQVLVGAYNSRGSTYNGKGSYDRAIADFDEAIRLDPKYALAHGNRGITYNNKGSYDRAIADLDEAIRLDPRYVAAYTARGFAYNNKGDHDRAIADFDEAIRLDPNYVLAYNNRGNAYNSKGSYDRAITDLDEAIRLNPKYALAYYNRGNAYNSKGSYDRAIIDLNEAIRLDPRHVASYISRGIAYNSKGDQERAIADYDEAIRLNPKNTAAYNDRGNAYNSKREHDRAIADYDEAIRLDPRNALAYSNRGNAYNSKGSYDRAIADLNEAIRLDPKNTKAYNNRGFAYNNRGSYDRAIDDLDEAIRLDPKYAAAYNNRGVAYDGRGEHDRANADFDEANRLAPNLFVARQDRQRAQTAAATPREQKSPAPGGPERRVALVIGNSQYRSAAFLPNPRRDAKAVADALRQTGFQSVELAMDIDRDGMVKALRSFRGQADKADWALIYFAGHGIEINRVNYLIPVDAKLLDDRDVKAETVSYEELLDAARGAKMLRLLVLDACRVNPFKDSMRYTIASRGSNARGLAPPPEAEPGTMVVYSAKDGEVAADDVDGVNSPFARAFVTELKVPGREVRRLFDNVRDDVLEATNNRQQPFTYGSLSGRRDFYFVAKR